MLCNVVIAVVLVFLGNLIGRASERRKQPQLYLDNKRYKKSIRRLLAKLWRYQHTYYRSDMDLDTGKCKGQPGDEIKYSIDGKKTICDGRVESNGCIHHIAFTDKTYPWQVRE